MFEKLKNKIAWKSKNNQEKIDMMINLCCMIIIFLGVGVSLYMLYVNRTLWLDEAMGAFSFSQRNIINLTFGAFEWNQTAPVIYLYIVKFITLIFGNTEITLRVFSFISYIMLLVLAFVISNKIFKMKYPIFPVAYFASMTFILKYSNIFKVYMFETVCVLLVLLLYYLYKNNKINFKKLIIAFMVLIWASNPSCFFIGGVLLYELGEAILNKDKNKIKQVIIGIAAVFICFIIYYLYWLNAIATSDTMQGYWANNNFPLIPTSMADIIKAKQLCSTLIGQFDNYNLLIVFLSILSLLIGIYKKDKYKIIIILSMLITLFASYINMFPVDGRMWLFIYPIMVILTFDTLNILITNNIFNKFIVVCLALFLIFQNKGIRTYMVKDNIYWKGEEANPLIDYVDENIKKDEKLFVYYHSIPAIKYRLGYNNDSIGNYKDNIIYGTGFYNTNDNLDDIKKVVSLDKCYLLFSHFYYDRGIRLIEEAEANGYLELVYNPYQTELYYYVKNINDMKTNIRYEIKSANIIDDKYILTLTIHNIGNSILNHNYESVVLSSRDKEQMHVSIPKMIDKNSTINLTLNVKFTDSNEINLQLYNEDHYWFDEIGIEPIKITRDMFENK